MSDSTLAVLSRFLQPAVARVLAAGGNPDSLTLHERRDVVVLSADMRGFTQTSQMLPPTTVLALLDAYFTGMAEVIEHHGGTLIGLQGDTLMAAFGVPDSKPDASSQALQAAEKMQTAYQALAEEWQEEFGIRTALGIGINRGEAVVGITGAQNYQNYMVFGDCVELAVRFMQRARAGEYVFPAPLKKSLDAAGLDVVAVPLPPLEIAGRDPVPLFGVILETRLDFT